MTAPPLLGPTRPTRPYSAPLDPTRLQSNLVGLPNPCRPPHLGRVGGPTLPPPTPLNSRTPPLPLHPFPALGLVVLFSGIRVILMVLQRLPHPFSAPLDPTRPHSRTPPPHPLPPPQSYSNDCPTPFRPHSTLDPTWYYLVVWA